MKEETPKTSMAFVGCQKGHRFTVLEIKDSQAGISTVVCPECGAFIEKLFPHQLVQPQK